MKPRFSVITPTNRRPESLLRMLDALGRQDYPFDSFEVIVVVDGDVAVAESMRGREFPFRLRVLSQDPSGPAAARNRGLAEAAEPYALFLDDDVVPAGNLITRHAASHAEPGVVVIGPLVAVGSARPAPWTRWEWATLEAQYSAMQAGRWAPTPRQFYTGNASAETRHVMAAGGFNTEFRRGEDVELAWRLHARGLRFVFDPQARAEHHAERSFNAWLAAAKEYGRTDVMLERIRSGQDLPGWTVREFQARHPYTKAFARAAVALPAAWRFVPRFGRLAMWLADRNGMDGAARQICSALFTAAFWRGVAEQLGREKTMRLTASGTTSMTARNAA